MADPFPTELTVPPANSGQRLDQFLASHFSAISRSRIQLLISQDKVLVDGKAAKASFRLKGGERIAVVDAVRLPPLRAMAEEIALDIVYEDADLAVINKPAGMMVHAGAGATDELRNRGTLVNALLYRFGKLSEVGGELRPGIVHRLDKETSGLMVVAKNDSAHRALGESFSKREVKKTYLALVHGWPKEKHGTISSSISRDSVRRIRMSTKGSGGRQAVTHYQGERWIVSSWGKFALLKVRIDTGRTHQIRVHLASIGHPVVGDALYGAPREIKAGGKGVIRLPRNFLHSAALEFRHPRTGEPLSFERPLPPELRSFMERVEAT